jgi:peptidoglycan glycosyltransferase
MVMALVTDAIANGGTIMKPYVIKEIKDRYGMNIRNAKPSVLAHALSMTNANKIKDLMIKVVKSGTGTNARIYGITVAGKTGSAEDGNKTHSWFTALAPAENPQIVVTVIVENGGLGGNKAARIAREVLKQYLIR